MYPLKKRLSGNLQPGLAKRKWRWVKAKSGSQQSSREIDRNTYARRMVMILRAQGDEYVLTPS